MFGVLDASADGQFDATALGAHARYVSSSGHLFYDVDGFGQGNAEELVATLKTSLLITASDFAIATSAGLPLA